MPRRAVVSDETKARIVELHRTVSCTKVAQTLHDENVPTPSGRGRWSRHIVERLLREWEWEAHAETLGNLGGRLPGFAARDEGRLRTAAKGAPQRSGGSPLSELRPLNTSFRDAAGAHGQQKAKALNALGVTNRSFALFTINDREQVDAYVSFYGSDLSREIASIAAGLNDMASLLRERYAEELSDHADP